MDSRKLEHERGMIYPVCPAFFGLGLEDNHVPTFWLPLYIGALSGPYQRATRLHRRSFDHSSYEPLFTGVYRDAIGIGSLLKGY